MSLLEVDSLRTGYGALPVLQGISFAVEEGKTAVMFGLNGAGKTTTVNAIAGLLPAWAGEVRFDGKPLTKRSMSDIVRAGVALSPEGRRVFPDLTVRKNLELGAWTRRSGMTDQIQRVFSYFPRLEERPGPLAGAMSGGDQHSLAIARALMSRRRLLLVDEASLGLSP